LKSKFCYLLLLAAISINAQAKFTVPSMTSAVTDSARLLTVAENREIENGLRVFRESGGAQIAVLTVDDLNGLPIEQAAIEVVEFWKLGGAKADDGALVLISKKERAIRIEVGQGLEGKLTDINSKRIIEDVMIPLFRAGQVSGGIVQGLIKIAETTNPEIPLFQNRKKNWNGTSRQGGGKNNLFFFMILIFFILSSLFGPRSRRGGLGFLYGAALGSLSGGMGGRGGGGFGGFSGGGGGFSGGGASGRW